MSLMSAIRRVARGKGRGRVEDDKPEDLEDEDKDTGAEEDRTDPDAEEDDVENHAEDDEKDPDAEDDETDPDAEDDEDAADAEDKDEERSAKKMSASARAAYLKGRKAERGRISRILGSKAAADNPALAAHLAFATGDSSSKALSALKAAGASGSGRLAGRMNARPASRTGRGGEDTRSGRDASTSWGRALAKAGVKGKPPR